MNTPSFSVTVKPCSNPPMPMRAGKCWRYVITRPMGSPVIGYVEGSEAYAKEQAAAALKHLKEISFYKKPWSGRTLCHPQG